MKHPVPACYVRFPIYTRAAGAAHLPDSPDTPETNPGIPDSKAFSLESPPFIPISGFFISSISKTCYTKKNNLNHRKGEEP